MFPKSLLPACAVLLFSFDAAAAAPTAEVLPDATQAVWRSARGTVLSVMDIARNRMGGFDTNRFFSSAHGGVYYGRSGGGFDPERVTPWAVGQGGYVKQDARKGKADGFDASMYGAAIGIENNTSENFKFGLGYAYVKTDISTDSRDTDVKTHSTFLYGTYQPERVYVNAVLVLGLSEYDETTKTARLKSDYDATAFAAQIAAGYDAPLTPEIAVRFTTVEQDNFTNASDLVVKTTAQNIWTAVGGLKLSGDYRLNAAPNVGVTPYLKAAATYDFAGTAVKGEIVSAGGAVYNVAGERQKRFGAEAGAGVSVAFGVRAEISLTYSGKFKKDYQDHAGTLDFKLNF